MARTAEVWARLASRHNEVQDFCRRWNVTEFSVFGSVLCDQFNTNSDVDVLVAFDETVHWSLYDLVEMKQELEKLFERRVDLIERKAIRNPFRRHAILTTRHVLYAA